MERKIAIILYCFYENSHTEGVPARHPKTTGSADEQIPRRFHNMLAWAPH